ncbi:Isoprenylcysteine carboxyl methyltransferase [Artemisia annua]|uniref:Protein-S-isoprenylcysteine O-methyltransferase n=1 Tax=Artemisia annua TaxID=35608 RepID=A0A2U1LBF7_ARTAN|nr:Isoprenylcysteine carboxyl methyltransferase [Artemisia annua]
MSYVGFLKLICYEVLYKDDEKEHVENGDKHKETEEITEQTKPPLGNVIFRLSTALHSSQVAEFVLLFCYGNENAEMSLKQYLGVMKAELLSELLDSSFSEIFSYTASRQLSQMFFAILFFHGSEYLLAIFFHGKSNVTLSSLLISQQYFMAMFFSVLEYLFELYFFPGLKEHWWISNVGLFMVIVGEIIRKLAIITAGRAFTHLIQRHHEEHHNLVTHGVYNIVRHPGYTGFFIWSVGTQIMLCNPLSTIAFTLVVWNFFHRRIPYEEYFLRQFFGSEYEEYAKVVSSGIPFVKPVYLVEIQATENAIGGIYSVLNQRREHVFEEMQRPGTPLYNIKVYLPFVESFGFSGALRASTSGQAFPQCVFDHWDMMLADPLDSTSQAATLGTQIHKRKGLKEQMTPLSEFDDKLVLEVLIIDNMRYRRYRRASYLSSGTIWCYLNSGTI